MTNDWEFKPARDFAQSPGERLSSVNREATLEEFAIGSTWQFIVRSYLKIFHRFTVKGGENFPLTLPFVIVANHASHMDALCIAAALPSSVRQRVYPIAAADTFFTSRILSRFSASTVNALPLTRKDSTKAKNEIELLRERLVGGDCGYILFPEGTRTRTGEMGKFKRGIGKLVAETNVPVIPSYIKGAYAAFPPHSKLPRIKPIEVQIGSPMIFSQFANSDDGWEKVALDLEVAVRGFTDEPKGRSYR